MSGYHKLATPPSIHLIIKVNPYSLSRCRHFLLRHRLLNIIPAENDIGGRRVHEVIEGIDGPLEDFRVRRTFDDGAGDEDAPLRRQVGRPLQAQNPHQHVQILVHLRHAMESERKDVYFLDS